MFRLRKLFKKSYSSVNFQPEKLGMETKESRFKSVTGIKLIDNSLAFGHNWNQTSSFFFRMIGYGGIFSFLAYSTWSINQRKKAWIEERFRNCDSYLSIKERELKLYNMLQKDIFLEKINILSKKKIKVIVISGPIGSGKSELVNSVVKKFHFDSIFFMDDFITHDFDCSNENTIKKSFLDLQKFLSESSLYYHFQRTDLERKILLLIKDVDFSKEERALLLRDATDNLSWCFILENASNLEFISELKNMIWNSTKNSGTLIIVTRLPVKVIEENLNLEPGTCASINFSKGFSLDEINNFFIKEFNVKIELKNKNNPLFFIHEIQELIKLKKIKGFSLSQAQKIYNNYLTNFLKKCFQEDGEAFKLLIFLALIQKPCPEILMDFYCKYSHHSSNFSMEKKSALFLEQGIITKNCSFSENYYSLSSLIREDFLRITLENNIINHEVFSMICFNIIKSFNILFTHSYNLRNYQTISDSVEIFTIFIEYLLKHEEIINQPDCADALLVFIKDHAHKLRSILDPDNPSDQEKFHVILKLLSFLSRYFEKNGKFDVSAQLKMVKAELFYYLEQINQTEEMSKQAFQLLKKSEKIFSKDYIKCLYFLSAMERINGNYQEALDYLNEALHLVNTYFSTDKVILGLVRYNLGALYMDVKDHFTYEKSKEQLEECYKLFEEVGEIQHLCRPLIRLLQLYIQVDNEKEAAAVYNLIQTHKDSIFDKRTLHMLAVAIVQYRNKYPENSPNIIDHTNFVKSETIIDQRQSTTSGNSPAAFYPCDTKNSNLLVKNPSYSNTP